MTRQHIGFTFDQSNMLLSLNIGFCFVRAAVACEILRRTSGPLCETTASRYLKLLSLYIDLPLGVIGAGQDTVVYRIMLSN